MTILGFLIVQFLHHIHITDHGQIAHTISTINHLFYFVSFDALHFSVISRYFPNTYTEPLDTCILQMYKKS